jgi:hypothetical protein
MAVFQLPGQGADVSKTNYGKKRSLYGEPKRTVRFRSYRTVRSGAPYKLRFSPYKVLDTSAAGLAS